MVTKEAELKGLNDGIDIRGREFYDYYRKNRKKTVPWLKDHTLFERAVGAMFLEIKNMMLEADGGVYLDGLGYFAMMMSPKKTSKKLFPLNPLKGNYKYIKKQHRYIPYFFGDIGNATFKEWTMSSAFTHFTFLQIKQSNKKYNLYYTALQQLHKANKQTKYTKHKDANNKTDN